MNPLIDARLIYRHASLSEIQSVTFDGIFVSNEIFLPRLRPYIKNNNIILQNVVFFSFQIGEGIGNILVYCQMERHFHSMNSYFCFSSEVFCERKAALLWPKQEASA